MDYFINQDGSSHLYSASIMLDLLRHNPADTVYFAFNSFSVPNASGHWLLMFLLLIFSPPVVTKLIVSLTFLGLVAAIVFLRRQTCGSDGLDTAVLFGAAIAFNWLWLMGFYNFLIGLIILTIVLGLFFRWRETLNVQRMLILSALILFVYFSHLISFVVLGGSLFVLACGTEKQIRRQTVIRVILMFLPALPFLAVYQLTVSEAAAIVPVWRSLHHWYSPLDWFRQLISADPFSIISRKTFPLTAADSSIFILLTPLIWLALAVALLVWKSWRGFAGKSLLQHKIFPFLILSVGCLLAFCFAPDDFGLTNGSILRERFLLSGLIFFVPVFPAIKSRFVKILIHSCLIFIILFQTLAVWDYAFKSDRMAQVYFQTARALSVDDKFATIVIISNIDLRFHSVPQSLMDNYSGVGNDIVVWDNYEMGHYLFPVKTKIFADREFIFELNVNKVLNKDDETGFVEKLSRLEKCFEMNHQKITTLLIWGDDPRVVKMLDKWYQSDPAANDSQILVLRHR